MHLNILRCYEKSIVVASLRPYLFMFLLLFYNFLSMSDACLLENDRNSVYVSVFEDAPIGSTLTSLPIRGQTFGPDATIQLRLVQGSDLVSLDQREKKLVLEKALDRDTGSNKFEVVLECRSLVDDHFPELNISTFVTIKDVNDNAPEFDRPEYSISLPEELPEGTPILLDFQAIDKDQEGPNSFVRYRIVEDSTNPHSQLLKIPDPYRTLIVVGGRMDFEKLKNFTVELEAEDGGKPPQKSRAKIHVNVKDVDDQNPAFQHENYHTNSIQESVFEVFPEPIFAKDEDTLKDPIYYELSGDYSEYYSINSSGTVRLVKDTVISTILFVHARQVNRPERFSTAILRITNQSSIEFQHLLYSIQLTSNSPKGLEVAQVKAISSNMNSKLRYSIVEEGDFSIATIEELTGRIFLNSTPTKERYNMKLMVTDGKNRAFSRLELTVKKVNVYEPEFDQQEYLFEVKNANLIGQVRAIDRDENDTISYKLLNLQTLFKLDKDGMLSSRQTLQLAPATTYELIVMAEDSQKHRTFVTVLLRTRPTGQLALSTILSIGIFFLLASIFAIMVMLVVRRVSSIWHASKRRNACWMAKTGDNGVVITGSIPTDIDNYSIGPAFSSRTKTYETPRSPIDEKERETNSVSYANAAATFPLPAPKPILNGGASTSRSSTERFWKSRRARRSPHASATSTDANEKC
uniref:Cadherin domain-containing protein n=1 Tax=Acrobeloides nanus TaxID=290746 RepID=A0A914E9N7_9BILA